MGRRGPKPKPSTILRLCGSRRAKDRERSELKAPAGAPSCPRWLDPRAKAAWASLIPMLEEIGVLAKVDRNQLVRYCRAWSRWRAAEEVLQAKGQTIEVVDAEGRVKYVAARPEVKIAKDLAVELRAIEDRFGMAPGARANMKVNAVAESAGADGNPKDRFFRALQSG